jgi:hypothetical protein
MATRISQFYLQWDMLRQTKIREWQEVQRYIFATDTNKTTNSKLPWSNKTTIPKLCQIRDNLFANYMAAMFPRKKSIIWEGNNKDDEDLEKKQTIEQYMQWVMDRNEFYDEVSKLVLDYIDYGNAIGTIEWRDGRVEVPGVNGQPPEQLGYVGPAIRRINPNDIVINPTSPDFSRTPKIAMSLISIGEVMGLLESEALDDKERKEMETLYDYLMNVRLHVSNTPGNLISKDAIYAISGFTSYRMYLESNFAEVLTFYGDIYDEYTHTLQKNRIIKVIDRHKVISNRQNPSFFGTAPIYHTGWRVRPDNLWAMGPLDNLVGMQYRIDHLENMKADVFDLIAYPPLKIKGYVEDFNWGPFERIYMGDDGDVELMSPDVQALKADNQIAILEQKMEEMAGSPKEAMGFRTPGEKTAYEVQRLENAASRIFQNKIAQFERQVLEPLLNAMLELARRKVDVSTIRIWDSEMKVATFQELTAEDLTGNGRLRPFAARHYAEQAIQVQNLNNFFTSALGHDPTVLLHFSSVGLAKMAEELLELQDNHIVLPFVRIAEQAQAQQLMQTAQEQSMMAGQTAAGTTAGDHDQNAVPPAGFTSNPNQMPPQPVDSRTAKMGKLTA